MSQDAIEPDASPWRQPTVQIALAAALPGAGIALLAANGGAAGPPDARSIVWLVLAAPLLEEFAFRGFVQGVARRAALLRRAWFGVTGANAITSLAFVAFHALLRDGLAAALVLAPSLLLGAVRDATGRIWPCVVLHALWNGVWLALVMLRVE